MEISEPFSEKSVNLQMNFQETIKKIDLALAKFAVVVATDLQLGVEGATA